MRRFLLDTNAAAHCIFRRRDVHTRVKQARLSGARIGIGLPVLAELLAGVELSASREKSIQIVDRNIRLFCLWPFTVAAARIYARLFAQMRQSGRTKSVMDLMIAAIALSLGNCTIVTSDTGFADISGIKTEDWAGSIPQP